MRPLLLFFFSWAVFAQGTAPKGNADDYPVHAQARSAALGAEFKGHMYSAGEQAYFVKGLLVVEVALYPPKGRALDVHSGNFVLRVNGRKQEILPQPPTVVAEAAVTSIVHPPKQTVLDTALPQGEHRGPVSGFLYFAHQGKVSAIKSLELRYEDAVLKLR